VPHRLGDDIDDADSEYSGDDKESASREIPHRLCDTFRWGLLLPIHSGGMLKPNSGPGVRCDVLTRQASRQSFVFPVSCCSIHEAILV
jgi:hypothetical protein